MMSAASNALQPNTLTLDWQFWDAQLETLEAIKSGDYDLVVFRGGYGSGKTVLGTRSVIEQALRVPHSDNLVLAQDLAKGGPTTFKALFKQLPGEDTVLDEGGHPENSPIVAKYHISKRRITLFNGAVIRLGSAAEWNRYAGGEFDYIYGDEVAHYEQTDIHKLLEMLVSRQRTENGSNVTLFTSTGNGYNQFYDIVARQVDADGEPLTTRIKNVVADSRDNPFLPEKEKLTRQFAGTSREEEALEGGFSATEGLVYPTFSREHHVVPEAKASKLVASDRRIYSYDAGWDDPRTVLQFAPTSYGQWIVLDCFYRQESHPEEIINPKTGDGWLADKPKGPLYCEHEPGHIQKFRAAGWPAVKANKDLDEGIPHVRKRLQRDNEERPGLLVSDKCTELIQEFMSYKEEHVGKKVAEDHCLDCVRYALYTHEGKPERSGRAKNEGYSGVHSF